MIEFSSEALVLSDDLSVNAILWVSSLPEDELGPSKIFSLMRQITIDTESGLRPILHIDAHGSAQEGLHLAPSGERVSWNELIGCLQEINSAAGNNLVCVFALCYGLHGYKEVSLSSLVPAYLFCAPEAKVSVGFLESETASFYRTASETGNVTSAFNSTLGDQMVSFHCQGLFLQALLKYIRSHCSNKNRQERLELLVTEMLSQQGISQPSHQELKQIRTHIRRMLQPGQHIIDHFAPVFLVGRSAAFSYKDIQRILDKDYPVDDASQ